MNCEPARRAVTGATVCALLLVGFLAGSLAGLPAGNAASSRAAVSKKCLQQAARLRSAAARAAAKQKCAAVPRVSSTLAGISGVGASTVPVSTTGSPVGSSSGPSPMLGGCAVFPADNAWNQPIEASPIHVSSDAWVRKLGADRTLHPDFGGPYGIPFVVVPPDQPLVPIAFTAYGIESDPGPYPVPLNAPVEGAPSVDGDRHVLVVQSGSCHAFELYRAFQVNKGWNADSGAVFDLRSNARRPDGWTSADAAGLSVTAGLVRFEDIADGALRHAVRFTAQCTQRAYVYPATHQAGKDDPTCPPMGARFRLKAGFDLSSFTGQTRIILDGLKRYGMIVADNGSSWFITGSVDPRWNVQDLEQLKRVPGAAFEAVESGPLRR